MECQDHTQQPRQMGKSEVASHLNYNFIWNHVSLYPGLHVLNVSLHQHTRGPPVKDHKPVPQWDEYSCLNCNSRCKGTLSVVHLCEQLFNLLQQQQNAQMKHMIKNSIFLNRQKNEVLSYLWLRTFDWWTKDRMCMWCDTDLNGNYGSLVLTQLVQFFFHVTEDDRARRNADT